MSLLFAVGDPQAGLEALDYVAVGVYLLATLGIVVWAARRQEDAEDFFLGSRRMPWLAVGMSLMATLLSTISYMGVPGEFIKNGMTMMFGYLAIPFTMAVVLYLWVPFFMRLRLTSAYEYLERRFNYPARLLASLLFLALRLGWMSLVVYTASMALAQMTGFELFTVIGVVGVAATLYTCVGGIRAVIWNDVLQFVMLFGGTIITIGYVAWVTRSGPMDWWANVTSHAPRHTSPQVFSWDITVRMTIVTAIMHSFFWSICTHGSDQVVLQRYFSTTSLKAARKSYLVNAVSDLSVGLLLALSGLALFSFYLSDPGALPEGMSLLTSADKVLPHFYAYQLPAGLGGLFLAGFLCDAMQTLDSGVNSISAVATKDLFRRWSIKTQSRLGELALARGLTLLVGLAVTGLAYKVAYDVEHSQRNIVDLMPRSFNMFLGPLASMFFIGMFLPRASARSAVPAVLGALTLSFAWSYWNEIPAVLGYIGWPEAAESWRGLLGIDAGGMPKSPSITLAIAAPCVSGVALAGLLSLVLDRGRAHAGREYSWFAIMRRPADGAPL